MKKIYLIATLLLCCLNSCIPPKKQSSEWKAKHVILIGIDAWGAYSMTLIPQHYYKIFFLST